MICKYNLQNDPQILINCTRTILILASSEIQHQYSSSQIKCSFCTAGAFINLHHFKMPLEVGCRGVIDKRNALTLETICNLVGIKAQQRLKGALSRIALLGSYRIYLARKSPEWSGGELISVS